MLFYIFRRIMAAIPVMLFVAIMVFGLLYLAPGDPAMLLAGDQASPETVATIREALKLDASAPERFASWMGQVLQGNLGNSIYSGHLITELVGQRIGTTLSLMVLSVCFALAVSLPLGVVAAWNCGSWIDRIASTFAVISFSMPTFLVGYVLAYFFGMKLGWLPVQGAKPISDGFWPWFSSLILPGLALSTPFIGVLTKMTRTTMLEVLSQDYIRTAKAKGLSSAAVLFDHALRNAALPIVTVIGLGVAGLLAGAVVTETVFALPGLGRLTADAIMRRDFPVIQGLILIFSFMYVVINLIVDLLYRFFDPRISY